MMTYEETMEWGRSQYADVLLTLENRGVPGSFTQTGGMCAALLVPLADQKEYLLITDAEDSLSWARKDQQGWAVGLYSEGDDHDGAIAFAKDEGNDVEKLMALVEAVTQRASWTLTGD